MKSRTSCFNATLFRRDITRFWPAWLIYLGYILLSVSNLGGALWARMDGIVQAIPEFVAINVIYGFIVAALLFGDLYRRRECYGLHALPLRRETIFFTHCLSGLLCSLVPNLVFTLIGSITLGSDWYLAFVWLACATISFLCFFSVAIFSVSCTGKRLGSFAVYACVVSLPYLAFAFYKALYQPLLYGISAEIESVAFLSPLYLAERAPVDFLNNRDLVYIGANWLHQLAYLAGCAGFGALGLLLYRKRHLESAGNFFSASRLRPVLLVLCTLGLGIVIQGFIYLFVYESSILIPLFSLLLGYLFAQMFLQGTTKIWKKSTLLGAGLLAAFFAVTLTLTALDPLGVTTRVPRQNQVESVRLSENAALTQEESIQRVIELHQAILEQKDDYEIDNYSVYLFGRVFHDDILSVDLDYTLKNGNHIRRSYLVPVDSPAGKLLEKLLGAPEYLFADYDYRDWDSFAASIQSITVQKADIPRAQWQPLLEALKADLDAGRLVQDWDFHGNADPSGYLSLSVPVDSKLAVDTTLRLWEGSEALQWLRDNGYAASDTGVDTEIIK